MVLFDAGIIDFEEPFKKVIHQGMILKDGVKMSKSLENTVSPDDYDSDYLRFYLMFLGHYFDGGSFNDNNFKGIPRFVNKLKLWFEKEGNVDLDLNLFQETIFKYTEDFKFNKVVSEFMILLNQNKNVGISQKSKDKIIELLSIYMPTIKDKLEIKKPS
jgi:leucyl-tRNA synthetase